MKRNGGLIRPGKVAVDNNTASGVFDLFDQYGYRKDLKWPTQPVITSVVASGNNNPDNAGNLLYGSPITLTVSGENFVGNNLFCEFNSITNILNNIPDEQLNIVSDVSAGLEFTIPLQRNGQVAASLTAIIRKGTNTSGTILFQQSFNVAAYIVEASNNHPVDEGQTVYTTLDITGVGSDVQNTLDVRFENNWSTADFYSDITPYDYSGSYNFSTTKVTYNGNMGTTREDALIEGTEGFTISPRAWNNDTLGYNYFYGFANTGNGYTTFQITDTSYFAGATFNQTNIDEGSSMVITFEAKDVAGRSYSWEIVDTSNALFDEAQWQTAVSGTGSWGYSTNSNGNYNFQIQAIPAVDFLTEGNATFKIRLKNDQGTVVFTSNNLTINDSSYLVSVNQTATTINEGSSVTFTVNGYGGVPNTNYPYYWKTEEVSVGTGYFQENDFTDSALEGSFLLSPSSWPNFSGTITRTARADGFTEGAESFQLKIGPTANSVTNNAGNVVTISDTSTGTAEPNPQTFTEWDLKVSSAPTGLTYVPSQSNLLTAFNTTYGYQTAGNAVGATYELYTSNSYQGDHLFETTVLFANGCSDPAIAIWSSGTPSWQWGTNSSRISLQQNCTGPYLYGTSQTSGAGGNTPTSSTNPITLHLHHQPSLSRTRAWVTTVADDWGNETTNRVGNIMQISNNYGNSGVYCGLSSDYDGASLGSTSTNFTKWRITPG